MRCEPSARGRSDVDTGRPRRARKGSSGTASKSTWMWTESASGARRVRGQEPRRARGGAGDRRRARARVSPVIGELEPAWRMLPEPLHRRHRDQRQDDVDRADRPPPRSAGLAGRGRGQCRHPAGLAGRRARARTRRSSANARASSSRTPSCSLPSARSSSISLPTTSTATATLDDYLAAKLRIFANQGNDDVAVYDGDEPALAGIATSADARAAPPSALATGDRDCELSLANGT